MKIDIEGKPIEFQHDDDRGGMVAPYALPAWAGFSHNQPGLEGARVLFMLQPDDDEELADARCYSAAIAWFLARQEAVKAAALDAILGFTAKLREEYGIEDEDLDELSSASQLPPLLGLSFVHIWPHTKGGLPYFGLELECSWDVEHGCGVMFHGTRVVDIGGSDAVQGAFDIADDGGTVDR